MEVISEKQPVNAVIARIQLICVNGNCDCSGTKE